jgi:hypothetical protein
MACKVCEFWAREGDFKSGHHPTCPHASLAERLRGIQVKTAYEAAVRDAAVDELERLKAAEVVGRVNENGSVSIDLEACYGPSPLREAYRAFAVGEAAKQLQQEWLNKLTPVGKDFDRNWKPVAELCYPELSREEIEKSLQEFRAAGWTITPSHDELKLDVGAAADADEPVIRGG